MGTAKRLYLYGISSISLLVLAVGLVNLLGLVFGEIADALGATTIGGGGGTGREQASLAIALVAVGLPIFAVHWALVGRGWRGTGAAAAEDRSSSIRAFHLGFVATVALAVATYSGVELLHRWLGGLLGVEAPAFGPRWPDTLAILLIALPIWWYHQGRRNADIRHDHLHGPAAWLTRLHRYAWAFVGLIILVVGASQTIETLATVLIGGSDFGSSGSWWRDPLASSLALVAVGGGVFAYHADDARRAMRDASRIGEDDRSSAIRATYFGTVILVMLIDVALSVAASLTELARLALGVSDGTGPISFLELVVGPLLVAVPYLLAGLAHRSALYREASGRSPDALDDAERLTRHLAGAVGLAIVAVGSAQLLGRILEIALGVGRADDLFRAELAGSIALMLVGAVLWIPAWTMISRRRHDAPLVERRATVGRAYLYLVVAASLVAAVPSAAYALYRVIDAALGGGGVTLASELAIPMAVVVVAGVIAVYHGRILVTDLRSADVTDEGAMPVAAIEPAATPADPVPGPGASMTLTLRGPAGTDLESIASALRERLPVGVLLDAH